MIVLWWIFVGIVAGWLTGRIMSGSGYGAFVDVGIGILGAMVGGFVMRTFILVGSGKPIYTILVAALGAVIPTLLLHLISRHPA
jgi:uncharacterized membrane protein YeaQ/YmgE (transglycosylase-associated protein family)